VPDGKACERHCDNDRPDTGCRPQKAEPERAKRQDVPREDRHQRHRAAEQDGEEIQRDRTEHHLFAEDEAEAGEDRVPGDRLGRAALLGLCHHEDENGRGDEEGEGDRIGKRCADPVKKAARHRTDDRRGLPGRGVPRDGIAQIRGRHEIGRQRLHGRGVEGALNTEHHQNGEDDQRIEGIEHRQKQHRAAAQGADDHADRHDRPAIVAIGDRAGDKDQQQRRQELNKTDQSEIERAARLVIHLPADRNRQDLRGKGAEEAGEEEAQIGCMPESGETITGRDCCHLRNFRFGRSDNDRNRHAR